MSQAALYYLQQQISTAIAEVDKNLAQKTIPQMETFLIGRKGALVECGAWVLIERMKKED